MEKVKKILWGEILPRNWSKGGLKMGEFLARWTY
jgi:hypothetical protein